MICDVSKWQGKIDWDLLAPNLDFCILKASSGKGKDSEYDRNASECERLKVPYHSFHFLYCKTEAQARSEAKIFAEAVKGTKPLFFVLDVESESKIPVKGGKEIIAAFENELKSLLGADIRISIYIGHELYDSYSLDYSHYAYVWIPIYGSNKGTISSSEEPRHPCDLWQYTSKGKLPGISGNVDLDLLMGTKPLSYFTHPENDKMEGENAMAIDFLKYIDSTKTHYISNSGSDEKKTYRSGEAGDQTGKEWELKAWYNRPWTVVLRYPDPAVGLKIAELGVAAALNNKIGYDQGQRTTYWKQLEKVGYDPSKITIACEEDCTAGVTANVKAVGYLMGIKALQGLSTDTYSGNMKSRFVKAGFQALTSSMYLTSPNYLLPGDILLYESHHAATNISYGKYAEKPTNQTIPEPSKPEEPSESSTFETTCVAVVNGNYYVRVSASSKAKEIGVAFKGENLPYLGETDNGWYKVSFKGQSGWISTKCGYVTTADISSDYKMLTVKSGSWNVRKGAGILNKSLGIVHGGDKLPYLKEAKNKWYKVRYKNKYGWISSKAIVD